MSKRPRDEEVYSSDEGYSSDEKSRKKPKLSPISEISEDEDLPTSEHEYCNLTPPSPTTSPESPSEKEYNRLSDNDIGKI